jgi:hypothetical protein
MTDSPKLNLRQKLVQIYNELDHVDKAGENKKQSYRFVRAADVMRPVRAMLAKWGIYAETNYELLTTYDIKTNSGGNMHTATVKATIVLFDADSDETKTISGLGDGADSGDKGIFKAQTGATKNALRNGTLLPDEADPEADESVDNSIDEPVDGRALSGGAYDQPSFQDARHTTARPTAAPAKATKTAAPVAVPQTTSAAQAVSREPGDDSEYDLPTEAELTGYRAKFKKLGDDLSTVGKLKSSKGLPINRKLLVFLISITKADDAKTISKLQWDDFFARVDQVQTLENGLVGLGKLVNKYNGLDEKK